MLMFIKKRERQGYHLAALIAAITVVVYLPALRNEFVDWDDNTYVLNNPFIRSLNIAFLRWSFFDFYASNWHPLTWISHALDYALWGLNPLGHHLTSVILHAVNTFLVVVLVMRLQEAAKGAAPVGGEASAPGDRGMLITAGVTGLLFGLHPVHVESVAWIAERKDLLCALFFLLSIAGYRNYVAAVGSEAAGRSIFSRFSTKGYLLSLGFFILALLSKPMAVSLPVVLLILDWYPFRRLHSISTVRAALVEKLPFVAFSLISSVLTILAQQAGGALASSEVIPLSTRLLASAGAVVMYLGKIVLPVDLLPFYQYPRHVSSIALAGYFLAVAVVAGVTALCVVLARKRRLWPSLWAYYLVTLLPVLGVVQVGGQFMADRYLYLPGIGPFLALGIIAGQVSRGRQDFAQGRRTVVLAGSALAVLMIVPMTYLTLQQIDTWKNSFSLWGSAIEKEPEGVPMAYYGLGTAYQKQGLIDKAVESFDKAIALDPALYQAYDNKGVIYGEAGMYDKALECFNRAIAIRPNYSAYGNRGLTQYFLGQYDSALEDLTSALRFNKNFAGAYYNRGNVYLRTGKRELALRDFKQGCDLGDRRSCSALQASGPMIMPDQKKK
jgi:tetratricopeptide (TPR) repeat protein